MIYIRGVILIFIQGPHTAQFDLMWAGPLKRKEGRTDGRKEGRKDIQMERRKIRQDGKMEGRKEGRTDRWN